MTINTQGASQTLIEDQQANIKTLTELNLNQARTIEDLQKRIEELEKWDAIESRENEKLRAKIEQLEAALKCFEHHAYRDIEDQSFANDVIAELGGMPNDRTPIAALQENEL